MSVLQQYEDDLTEFKCRVDDTERQLGTVFCQAFEDAAGLEHAFKVWKLSRHPRVYINGYNQVFDGSLSSTLIFLHLCLKGVKGFYLWKIKVNHIWLSSISSFVDMA